MSDDPGRYRGNPLLLRKSDDFTFDGMAALGKKITLQIIKRQLQIGPAFQAD